jgi:hypothetical protein
VTNDIMSLPAIAGGRIRFLPPTEGGRRSGAPPGAVYATTIQVNDLRKREERPEHLLDAEHQVSAQFGFREELGDGWRSTDIGIIARQLIEGDLVVGSRWLVMEGERVVGEFVVTSTQY